MSKEERKVPELRFKGFHDDWEQRELQSVVSITGGATPLKSNPSYWGGPIEWLSSQEIKNKYVSRGTYSITQKAIDEKTTKLIGSGIPLIVSRSGILARRVPISITTKSMAINQDIKALAFNRKLFTLDYFFAQLQSNEKFILKSIVKTGTTVQSISMPDFNKIMLTIPNLDEQGRIGRFFNATDKIIELHQRKHHILGKLYSTFVDKVYPEKDKNTPMLRFNNYNREWDKTKLELLLEEFTIKSNVENEYQILSSTNTGMEFRNGRVSGKSNKGYKIIKNGDLVLSPQNLWLGNININNLGTGLVSPSYKTFHVNKGDGEFLEPQLHTKRMLNTFENVSTQGASVVRRNLDIDLFNQIIIKTPQNDEKAEISNLLISIKTLNKFYEKKLKYLQTIKKEYLRKMFL